jgi:MFS transporter, OFA family, oxalate/formate antiporter
MTQDVQITPDARKMRLRSVSDDPEMTSRWYVLGALVLCMMAVANSQYAWTLFTTPIRTEFKVSLAIVQVTLTVFIAVQTWLVPLENYLVDRLGPRWIMTIAGVIVGVSWIWSSKVTSIPELYLAYGLGGVGVGAVYGASIGTAAKWFPDRRGFAAGCVAGSYGFGTLCTVLPIQAIIDSTGWRQAFFTFGILQGVVVMLASQFVRAPRHGWIPVGWVPKTSGKGLLQSARSYTPGEMLSTAPFYILYAMMTMVAFGGMMVTAQLSPIGKSYGYDKVTILFTSAISLALMLDRFLNGFTRPMWGFISDKIGRYNTMALAFGLEAIAITIFAGTITNPVAFVIMSGMTFFAWGEIYSLFPAAITDVYGTKYAATNYGIQYTSKGVATLLAAPGAAWLMERTGSWLPVLYTAVGMDLCAAALAFFWLKPMVARMLSQANGAAVPAPAGARD